MSFIKNTHNFLLDIIFPIKCISCNHEGSWLCRECLEKLPLRINQICPLCEKKITPAGRICFSCRRKSALNGLLVAASYKNTHISSAVHCYKYRFLEKMREPLGKILIKAFLRADLPLPDAIIPVPLHPRRLRWRGFNQAGLLANCLSENLTPGFPIPVLDDILIRTRYTHPQMQIKNYSRRQKNIENAFAINTTAKNSKNKSRQNLCYSNKIVEIENDKKEPADNFLRNKRILLVDDIATTGSTLFEGARVLKNAGAQEVFAIVIARQELK